MANTNNQRDQRLQRLSSILYWEGELKNQRVQSLLNVASVQASRSISEFRKLNPSLLNIDTQDKKWVLSNTAQLGAIPPIEEYLAIIRNYEENEGWIEDARTQFLEPPPNLFSCIRKACIDSTPLKAVYASTINTFNEDIIYARSIANTDAGWVVRIWSQSHKQFQCLELNKVYKCEQLQNQTFEIPKDLIWDNHVNLIIRAHRDLDDKMKSIYERNSLMGERERVFTLRAPLSKYFINFHRIAIDPKINKPPEYLGELVNYIDIKDDIHL
ncbi:hypothetical protein TERTU_4136 [Teredinibacter turnerae T7901]|uniref:DNA-binding transcriptional repressor CapW winged helix-turn-helix domain-containing protein n=1 Tax=Teredinibacter turnerae (strain ATCC 39867 / T7901) TaxID=377629 RepID=C5BUI3_TERTT|nr:hypothetical protein [Teredinibacter turnerae]ACR11223.1 hypothetical protein TERTU_4136 [Teredinibacter turnerae T7901]